MENKLDSKEWPHQSECPAAWNGSGAVRYEEKLRHARPLHDPQSLKRLGGPYCHPAARPDLLIQPYSGVGGAAECKLEQLKMLSSLEDIFTLIRWESSVFLSRAKLSQKSLFISRSVAWALLSRSNDGISPRCSVPFVCSPQCCLCSVSDCLLGALGLCVVKEAQERVCVNRSAVTALVLLQRTSEAQSQPGGAQERCQAHRLCHRRHQLLRDALRV